jgi:hypothetical protein
MRTCQHYLKCTHECIVADRNWRHTDEIVTYSRKLALGGVSVVMGRGTMAQTYFVASVEAFYLMYHSKSCSCYAFSESSVPCDNLCVVVPVRVYPYVSYKHNLMEALGHCAMLLLYSVTLILRNQDDSQWEQEWFPKEGCKRTRCLCCNFLLC